MQFPKTFYVCFSCEFYIIQFIIMLSASLHQILVQTNFAATVMAVLTWCTNIDKLSAKPFKKKKSSVPRHEWMRHKAISQENWEDFRRYTRGKCIPNPSSLSSKLKRFRSTSFFFFFLYNTSIVIDLTKVKINFWVTPSTLTF